jgi:hypothetical protein|tara:strand:+ start:214 stop:342 length:129 start_codon:yes stop_codon:yes gene_type:complete
VGLDTYTMSSDSPMALEDKSRQVDSSHLGEMMSDFLLAAQAR